MSAAVDTVVVGAGVVGLAVARELAVRGCDVVIVEREAQFGLHTSSRNSEVIHAGLFYPIASNKARLCVDGKRRLYDYCQQRGIAHRRVGKLVVANGQAEEILLSAYIDRAIANGVDDLELLDATSVRALEPALVCTAALLSPSSGIVDSHALMLQLLADVEAHGGQLARLSELIAVETVTSGFRLQFSKAEFALSCRRLVNCGGLWASAIAANIDAMPRGLIPRTYFAKGQYYGVAGCVPFQRLIYPIADNDSLGIHVTVDLTGAARFGPDVRWVEAIDYSLDPFERAAVAGPIRRYYPSLDVATLAPLYAGIRPKLVPAGATPGDFLLQDASVHRVDGLVNLFGIESPGLTASLALAAEVGRVMDAAD
ncbi:MAG: NAD(P)/FAD-dependent oxidoreductase [Pseudomonadota bacterium]